MNGCEKLSTAKLMLENGSDAKTVLDKTGWFRGDDGEWRFTIYPDALEVPVLDGLETDDVYSRFLKLWDKDSLTEEDEAEFSKMDIRKCVCMICGCLIGYVRYDGLFETYTELARVHMDYLDSCSEKNSQFSFYHRTIYFKRGLEENVAQWKRALADEIQNLVQFIESEIYQSKDVFLQFSELDLRIIL